MIIGNFKCCMGNAKLNLGYVWLVGCKHLENRSASEKGAVDVTHLAVHSLNGRYVPLVTLSVLAAKNRCRNELHPKCRQGQGRRACPEWKSRHFRSSYLSSIARRSQICRRRAPDPDLASSYQGRRTLPAFSSLLAMHRTTYLQFHCAEPLSLHW